MNFEVGQGPEADVAFHFNPRFDGWDKVVLNTRQNGNWGKEEKKRSMPFSKGAAFELVFMVLAEHYKVGVSRARPPLPTPPSPLPFLPPSLPFCLPLIPPSLPFFLRFSSLPSPSLLPSYLTFLFFSFPPLLPLFLIPIPPPRRAF